VILGKNILFTFSSGFQLQSFIWCFSDFQVHMQYFQMTGLRCTSIADIVVQMDLPRTETIM
jgi:hypothetical protein